MKNRKDNTTWWSEKCLIFDDILWKLGLLLVHMLAKEYWIDSKDNLKMDEEAKNIHLKLIFLGEAFSQR